MNFKIRDWILPIALFMSMVLDGMISVHLSSALASNQYVAAIHLLLVGVVILNLVYDDNFNHFYLVLGLGLMSDWYYYGFIGINFIFLPLITLLIRYIAKAIPATFSARLLVVLIVDVMWTVYVFVIFNIFGLASISSKELVFQGIIPSLIVIFVIFGITYHFWVDLVIKYPFFRK